ncbi:Pectate lyase superfamily protein [Neisseria zoodegmatis]|uniref:Pectate lyase superfamily protein n=1 Tax=Neisseria zoodegmatis TaxID=326523 RepID=A0A378WUQ2_9NEIS|nr:right-handed parallel beta-helix repeat-containing protein [Neisseria zoodegmatis]SUA44582.1 Pectate lyase superfamily protein [Neisseria zoodegmatis]
MSSQIVVSVGKLDGGGRFTDAEGVARYSVKKGSGEPLYIRAEQHAAYQLADADTGLMPENIELVQMGNHLHIRAKGSTSAQPDIVIEDYYIYVKPNGVGKVFALDAGGNAHYYASEVPETTLLAEEVTVNRASSGGVNKLALALGGLAGAGLIGALAGGSSGKSSGEASAPASSNKPEQVVKKEEKALLGALPSESEKALVHEKEEVVSNRLEVAVNEAPVEKNNFVKEVATDKAEVAANQTEVETKQVEVVAAKEEVAVNNEMPSEIVAEVKAETEPAPKTTISAPAAEEAPLVAETDLTPKLSETEKPVEVATVAPVKPVGDTAAISPESLEKVGNNDTEAVEVRFGKDGHFYIYQHKTYGKYIDAAEFGTDSTGKTDSLAAINNALAAAHEEKVAVRLSGNLYISDQIVLNEKNAGVTGIFGDGMGKTVVSFDKAQKGVYNPNTNEDDVRKFAGILVDGQSNKTIADLSVKYTNPDFYRKGQSYFGKVNGILVNDADNTLISKVEVSGANRAGVFFTSTQALAKDPESARGRTYKARLTSKEVDEHYENLPLGENNRIVGSYLHHNRVAGALVAFQKGFLADGNKLAWNGHEADGGTGYGISGMAGSYNYGLTFTNNQTDHNYRKGLDVHDGDDIVIKNNTLVGDRLYGIAVYNRQFTMDTVKIADNTIIQDPKFRLDADDNPVYNYHGYSGIQLQTNAQFKDLNSSDTGRFEIRGNIIKNLEAYKNAQQTYGIEFRNHEQKMHYKLDISDNVIEGESSKYMIAIINNTRDVRTGEKGLGTGDINISGNKMNIGSILWGNMPIFVNEHNNDGRLRGKVTIDNNKLTVREHSDGYIEGVQMIGNAESYHIINNEFEIHGNINKPLFSVLGRASDETPELHIYGNKITTDLQGSLSRNWIEHRKTDVFADGNTHNNKPLDKVQHINKPAAGFSPEDEESAADVQWDIGTDSISGVPVHHDAGSVAPSVRSESVVLGADNQDDELFAESHHAPALDDLLSVAELNLSGLLGKQNHAAFADSVIVAEYRQSADMQAEQWQSEVSAYIV